MDSSRDSDGSAYRSFRSYEDGGDKKDGEESISRPSVLHPPRPSHTVMSKQTEEVSDKEALLQQGEGDSSGFVWKHKNCPRSIFSNHAITPTQKYDKLMHTERTMYVLWFVFLVVCSPLVFRYAMGSYSPDDTVTEQYLLPANATMFVAVKYQDCVPCEFSSGVTLKGIEVIVRDVTVPDRSGNTPSIAIYTSQNFQDW